MFPTDVVCGDENPLTNYSKPTKPLNKHTASVSGCCNDSVFTFYCVIVYAPLKPQAEKWQAC